jgi:hypothetical protein
MPKGKPRRDRLEEGRRSFEENVLAFNHGTKYNLQMHDMFIKHARDEVKSLLTKKQRKAKNQCLIQRMNHCGYSSIKSLMNTRNTRLIFFLCVCIAVL